ncbi:MAG TPA: hypothetical protein VMB78_04505 [Dissulfurispiraceae bacterium]|nr:hypothetical protein [Dissulfurispiraceae bacterium]
MNNRFITFRQKCCLLFMVVLFCGCAARQYTDDFGNEWISKPLSELKQAMSRPDSYASKIGWHETTYPLANGYYGFVQPIDKDCFINWKINPRDMIVGYSTSGTHCDIKETTSVENLQNVTPREATGW